MRKKIFIILILFTLLLNFSSCKNIKNKFILFSSKGDFFILDENLNLIKKIQKNLSGKALISEVNGDMVLFNLQSEDQQKNGIFLLNLDSEELTNISEGIEGKFLYNPKFYDNEYVLFSVRDKNMFESLYIYSLKEKNLKNISKDIKASYIYPIFIDDKNKKIYIHLLKEKENHSQIALYDLTKDELTENYISFDNNFFIADSNENGEFIIINYDIKNIKQKIQIVNLTNNEFKNIFEIKNGDIYNPIFSLELNEVIFKLIPSNKGAKQSILIIDRNGKVLKEILSPFDSDFYIMKSKGDLIFIMAQEKGEIKYKLYSLNKEKENINELISTNKFFGGDLLISKTKDKIMISEFQDNISNKDYIIMNSDGNKKENINKKLNIDKIDSIIFLK
ncbi:MAG: hypothetical protein ACPLN1_03165 [Caldisericia bacterium]